MTEAEWLACSDPKPMLDLLNGKVSDRKLRLFAAGCVRRFWRELPNDQCRRAVEATEKHADGKITDQELGIAVKDANRFRPKRSHLGRAAYDAARYTPGHVHWDSVILHLAYAAGANVPDVPPTAMSYFVGDKLVTVDIPMNPQRAAWNAARDGEYARQCCVLRDIIGDPFHAVILASSSPSSTVTALAQMIYTERAFDRMSELADALEKAGCTNGDVLTHCRSVGPHVRGCWVVDLILDKH